MSSYSFILISQMSIPSVNFVAREYVRGASHPQLASSQSHLLTTLLTEEDQHDYNRLLQVQLPSHLLDTLHQVILSSTFQNVFILKLSFSVNFISPCFLIDNMDVDFSSQKINHWTTFDRFINSDQLCYTLIQISRFFI